MYIINIYCRIHAALPTVCSFDMDNQQNGYKILVPVRFLQNDPNQISVFLHTPIN